jgi:hypothetical protein
MGSLWTWISLTTLQVTTFGSLPVESNRRDLAEHLSFQPEDVLLIHLKKFDTEQQFSHQVT